MFRMKRRPVMFLSSLLMLGICVGCSNKAANSSANNEATLTMLDVQNGTVKVKVPIDGKEVEKTFKLAEDIEYMDSAGNVAAADIFTSGDMVLIVESEGTITKMTKKANGNTTAANTTNNHGNNLGNNHGTKGNTTAGNAAKETAGNTAKETEASDAFIQAADQIDMAEVKIGKLAEEHAASDAVKTFAQRMVSDHSAMNNELRDVASKQGITLDANLDAKHQALFDELSALKGADFDQAYTKDMVAGHEQAIARFEQAAKSDPNADVKAWAEKWLPTLREHLTLAQAAVKSVNGATNSKDTKEK